MGIRDKSTLGMVRYGIVLFLLTAFGTIAKAESPGLAVDWSIRFGERTVGNPVSFGGIESAKGVLVTLVSGKILVLNPRGKTVASMKLDLPPAAPAVAGDIFGNGKTEIAAFDVWGSVYCFSADGRRLWKYSREDNAGGLRIPVLADLDHDGKLDILASSATGHLYAVDSQGKLRLDVQATDYFVSSPAVADIHHAGEPELVFGTDDGDIYSINPQGELLWASKLDAYFGHALPLVADVNRDGRYEVYVSNAFSQPPFALHAVDATTGKELWKGGSVLQSYASTAVADLNGYGHNEILFGDKNTRLYCLDAQGKQQWSTQLDGRGIFFAPAIADLQGNGQARIFTVVGDEGPEHHSLYVLDANGHVLEALALSGGGVSSPALCRFQSEKGLRLLVYSGSGTLLCFRPAQNPDRAKILWAGLRNDANQSGFVPSSAARRTAPPKPAAQPAISARRDALLGTNTLAVKQVPPASVLNVRVIEPGGEIQSKILRPEPGQSELQADFITARPGPYRVDVRLLAANNHLIRERRLVYTLRPKVTETDADRARKAYHKALDAYLRKEKPAGDALLVQIENPWPNFQAASFFRNIHTPPDQIRVQMLGNEYESAAVAVTNLESKPATFRFACGPFQSKDKTSVEAPDVVEFHSVPRVLPDTTGQPAEDVLPLLGQGQTLRLNPHETRKVWLIFHSRSLAAGAHRATLRIGDLLSFNPPVKVPINVNVYPVRLPDHQVYHEHNWIYLANIRDPRLREATMKDALAHGVNVFDIPAVTVEVDSAGKITGAKTETHDSLIHELRDQAFFLVDGSVGLRWPAAFKPSRQLKEKTYAKAIRWYVRHMQSLGLSYKDYAFYIQDEPGLMGLDENFKQFVDRVRRIKAADPQIQVYANPTGGAYADVLNPLVNLIDVWQPFVELVRQQPVKLGKIFKRREQYWNYEAPADQRVLNPLGFYRMKPWVAFQMGMNGGGYWVYSYSDYWFRNRSISTDEYGTVYPTAEGPVTTKRWEASRDGIEDFDLLWMIRQTAQRSSSPLGKQALRLIDQAVAFVTNGQEKANDVSRHLHPYTPNYHKWMEYRTRLIEMQERLSRQAQ
ncbi:MAG TPA: PQQ-binding-like beta-propeller repeat protein [Terriglobia bacterium]|nr:PQQ-binding-like beta-propeller repeat protein [Terriglobia bacterium]